MPKKSTKTKSPKQVQGPKVSNKVKVQLDPNPTVDNISNFDYQVALNKATGPTFVGMPPVVMHDIRELSPRKDTEEIKTSLETNPFVKEEFVKEYPMLYTGKTKSKWENSLGAIVNWFKNLFN